MNIQPLGLSQGAGKAIEDVAAPSVRLGEAVRDHLVHEVVRRRAGPDPSGSWAASPSSVSACDVLAQEVAGGDLRDAELGHEELGLGALADAGRSQKENRPRQEGERLPGPV